MIAACNVVERGLHHPGKQLDRQTSGVVTSLAMLAQSDVVLGRTEAARARSA